MTTNGNHNGILTTQQAASGDSWSEVVIRVRGQALFWIRRPLALPFKRGKVTLDACIIGRVCSHSESPKILAFDLSPSVTAVGFREYLCVCRHFCFEGTIKPLTCLPLLLLIIQFFDITIIMPADTVGKVSVPRATWIALADLLM